MSRYKSQASSFDGYRPGALNRVTPGKYVQGFPVRLLNRSHSNTNPKRKRIKVPSKVHNHRGILCGWDKIPSNSSHAVIAYSDKIHFFSTCSLEIRRTF